MKIFESIRVAWDMLRTHKLRAFLTMVGVIIGVMSVTLIVMIASGFRNYLTNEFESLGADTIILFYDGGFGRRAEKSSNIDGLYAEDLQLLIDRVDALDVASGAVQAAGQTATYLDREITGVEVNAIDNNFVTLNKIKVAEGRHINQGDLDARSNVIVIGQEIKDRLFPDGQALGKFITFKGITVQVIGVAETVEIMGQNNGKDALMPLTTAQDKWIGGKKLTYITAKPKKGYTVDETMDQMWQVLMQRSDNKRIYRIDSRQSVLAVLGGIVTAAGAMLSGVAALSLLVGGIGIMNIMLVSVTERTREVGLRKAVGAPRGTILSQFLVESALLSLLGGLIGMGVAWLLGKGLTAISAGAKFPSEGGLQMTFPIVAAILAAGFSALIGVVFGLYPALRASSLSPIEALRTE